MEPGSAAARGLQRANRRTLVEHAYDQVRGAITSGQLSPGQRLIIDDLAADLGVSITPVREALRQLQREGLVSDVPYNGMQVAALSIAELRELYTVLGVLEAFATRRAVELLTRPELNAIGRELATLSQAATRGDVVKFRRHNQRFHRQIVSRGAGDGVLIALIDQLTRNAERYAAAGESLDADYLAAAQAEHEQLFACLREGRSDAAEALTRQHALTFAEHVARRLLTQADDGRRSP